MGNVLSEQVQDELLDVVEGTTTFLDSGQDTGEVVVREDNVGGVLGHVGTLQRGTVVDTVTSHGAEALASVQGFNHAHLGVGSATGNDQRKDRQGVNLIIGELVELGSSHDHGVGDTLAELAHLGRQDTDLTGDCAGSARVVTNKHVDFDTSFVARLDGGSGLRARRGVKTDQTTEHKVVLHLIAVDFLAFGVWLVVLTAGKSQHTQTKLSKAFHVLQDLVLVVFGHLRWLLLRVADVGRAASNHTLDGTLGEGPHLVLMRVLVNDTHLLDVGVEGEFSKELPVGVVTGDGVTTVDVESS